MSRALPDALVEGPAERNDLRRVRALGARVIVLIDGSFAHSLAVSPSEVRDVIRDGASVIGCSSMGALRAAECWPVGMIGLGHVYNAFREWRLESDDEVAVTADPDADHAPLTISKVAMFHAVREVSAAVPELLDARTAARLRVAIDELHFADRLWPAVFKRAAISPTSRLVAALAGVPDLKRVDAVEALAYVAKRHDELLAASTPPGDAIGEPPSPRYAGHDRWLGQDVEAARTELLRWMVGSGRLQRYVWPLVVGEPEFRTVDAEDAQTRPEGLRERLAGALCRLLRDEDLLAHRLWVELDFLDELDAELMHLTAVRSSAASRSSPTTGYAREWAQERTAVVQGFRDWSALNSDVDDSDTLYGAIPMSWVREAVTLLAQARGD